MPNIFEGNIRADGLKFAIVVSRFNEFISGRLLEGAVDALVRHGGDEGDIDVIRVPGAFEIPLAAKWAAHSGKYDAIICLGTVIRGATSHYEYVASESAKGIAHVSLETSLPIIFGILTTETIEQAIERAGSKAGNKGWDAAMAAMEMARLQKNIKGQA